MVKGFWEKLDRPFFALAPMANVTDAAFRFIIAKYSRYDGSGIDYGDKESLPALALRGGGPDVFWTEFVSADGLVSDGKKRLLIDLKYSEKERPIVAQLFSAKPDKMEEAAKLVLKLGFDGLDINMGCPDRTIVKQGAGAALIKNKKLAIEIIDAAKKGVKGKIPISVKTRVGYSTNELDKWLPVLLDSDIAAVTIHARTVKEMSKVPARWEHVKEAVLIRDGLKSETLILGNGDVADLDMAKKKARETGTDGVMIGRGIFGNPFLFSNSLELGDKEAYERRLKVLVEHTTLFENILSGQKSFDLMKKHFKAYVSGFDGAKELRAELMMKGNSAKMVKTVIERYMKVGAQE